MGEGIDWMIAVALFVAHLPGAVGRVAAFGTGPLLLGTGGMVLLCLLKSPLRWLGGPLIVLAGLWAAWTPQPEVLVASDGPTLAVRGADGRLVIHRSGRDTFTVREWLAADGDARLPTDPKLGQGFQCDEAGCIARLADGRLAAHVLAPDAFEEDCVRAVVVISSREALKRSGEDWVVTTARPAGQDRPWARSAPTAPTAPTKRPVPRDATPGEQDFEAGD
jgi:competence protein ComEC